MSSLEESFEKQLTCSICTDLLFDPITFLDCLHSGCGACCRSWFLSQSASRNPAPTCPVCREAVRETRPNAAFTSMIDDYIRAHPDKGRTPAEVTAARLLYKPGDKVVVGSTVYGAPAPAQRRRPLARGPASTVPPPPPLPLRRPSAPRQAYPAPTYPAPTEQLVQHFASLNISSPNRLRTPNGPNTVADVIALSRGAVTISCDSCSIRLDTSLHYECTSCALFHLCSGCIHRGKTCPGGLGHLMLPQRQQTAAFYPHLESGLFCDLCEAWVDSPRNGIPSGLNSFFWACSGSCNGRADWVYCLGCVRRGYCCEHELKLYTNNRHAPPRPGIVRGLTPAEVVAAPGDALEDRGYVRWHPYTTTCDMCMQNVLNGGSVVWYHCPECSGGDSDVCNSCATRVGSEGRCVNGHAMIMMATGDEGGDVRIVERPPIPAPDICGSEEPRCAIAEGASWGTEDGGLRFPAGAEIRGVRTAFWGGASGGEEVEWCWGIYGGKGGMFEKGLVRFVPFL